MENFLSIASDPWLGISPHDTLAGVCSHCYTQIALGMLAKLAVSCKRYRKCSLHVCMVLDKYTALARSCTDIKQKPRTTVRLIARDDMISRHDIRHAFSNRLHYSSCFVAKHAREEPFWIVAIKRVRVCVTQSSGNNLDSYLSCAWRGDGHVCYFKWLFRSPCHCRFASDGLANCILHMKAMPLVSQ